MEAPIFYYDFNSPYAYLASARLDAVLPKAAQWHPIALAFLLRAHDRVPWSMRAETRESGMRECERRAQAYGLPALRWPPGWPVESYSLLPLRAAWVAAEQGALREFTAAAFASNFVAGIGLRSLEHVLAAARHAGVDEDAIRTGIQSDLIKERLRAATDEALKRGVRGVPTVAHGEALYWGDDQLEAAAAGLSQTDKS